MSIARGSSSRHCAAIALAALATIASFVGAVPSAQAAQGHGVPGSVTGYAFDTCAAPAQSVMDAWREDSPYSGVGVYIGGSNRQCAQPALTPSWVKAQVKNGWHVLPLYVGLQASCSGYTTTMSSDLTLATQQGAAEAASAIGSAQALGISGGSTLYYDLEDYDLAPDDCRRSALSFLSGWTTALHAAGYRSGVYSNIAAAITSLDLADRISAGSYAMPDDIWFGLANGNADSVADDRVLSTRWDDHDRIHQYAINEVQSYGGFPLTVDANWMDVGDGSTPQKHPEQLCRGVDSDLRRYPALRAGGHGPAVSVAQCLLRRQHFTRSLVTGRYDAGTAAAVRLAQHKLDLRASGQLDRATWTALLARGSQPLLKVGSTGSSVARLQRSLTAALGRRTKADGSFDRSTARAVKKYQRRHHLERTEVVTSEVWDSLLGRG